MNQRQQAIAKVSFVVLAALAIAGCASTATKEVVATKEAPAAIGPYSQAIKFGNMLFLAGQISIDPKTNQLNTGSIEEQTKLVISGLRNLGLSARDARDVTERSGRLPGASLEDRMRAALSYLRPRGTYVDGAAPV